MLKLAWYLITDTDYWADLPDTARLPQMRELTDSLRELFGDEAEISAAHTAAAVEVMLRMAEHLNDAVRHAPTTVPDLTAFTRLLLGLNLLTGHLAQACGRLAYHADHGTAGGLSGLSDNRRNLLTQDLATVCRRLEETAGLFKEAYLIASRVPARQVRR